MTSKAPPCSPRSVRGHSLGGAGAGAGAGGGGGGAFPKLW